MLEYNSIYNNFLKIITECVLLQQALEQYLDINARCKQYCEI